MNLLHILTGQKRLEPVIGQWSFEWGWRFEKVQGERQKSMRGRGVMMDQSLVARRAREQISIALDLPNLGLELIIIITGLCVFFYRLIWVGNSSNSCPGV